MRSARTIGQSPQIRGREPAERSPCGRAPSAPLRALTAHAACPRRPLGLLLFLSGIRAPENSQKLHSPDATLPLRSVFYVTDSSEVFSVSLSHGGAGKAQKWGSCPQALESSSSSEQ